MKEEESINEFNARLCDIANEVFALGEKFIEENLVRKVLKSLPKRFAYKVTVIEEAKDVRKMKLEELMRSLQTFEMNLEGENGDKKAKGIAFQAKCQIEEMKSACDYDDELTEVAVQILKRMNKSYPKCGNSDGVSTGLLKARRNTRTNFENFDSSSQNRFNAGNNQESKTKNMGIQYRECHGFEHIQAEWANTLK